MSFHNKVLLIEDDEITRFLMCEIITGLGAQVETAANGAEGCDMLSDAPDAYGLVLMDMHMPEMSGIEAAQKIRTQEQDTQCHVPIIALTADLTYQDASRVRHLGMNGYTSKPVSPGTLMALIQQYCAAA